MSTSKEDYHFHIVDYVVFGAMLVLSASSGIYFGYYKQRKVSAKTSRTPDEKSSLKFGSSAMNEYLLGSRSLTPFPVAMSLVASYISAVTMLGTPSEIYNYGSQYWLIILAVVVQTYIVCKVYLPVFCSLKLGSSYEYLELRFNSSVRTAASVMFVIDEILFLPIIVYVPSLAFNQVTGVNIYLVGGVVTLVCLFYTLLGGIKAVVHTDAWQIMVMFFSVVLVTTLGTIALGGPSNIFERADSGGRLIFFDFDPSLYKRHSFWGVVIGGVFYWTSYNAVNQTMVQRYMTLPNLKKARLSIVIFMVGIILFISACCYAGILIFAEYFDCDPLSSGLIKNDDQLFPVYVMQTVGHLKGVPGLFIAGVFGAALSSLSVVLNSTAAVLLEDILKGCFNIRPSERFASYFVKGSIILLGTIAMLLTLVVDQLGGILGVATSLSAIAAGTTFGVFTLGMLVPWSNSKGALAGGIAGAFMSGWISFGSQAVVAAGKVVPHRLDVFTNSCPANYTVANDYPDESDVFPLYRLSFHWINPVGVISVLVVGTIVSFLTGPRKLFTIDPELISPILHKLLPTECFVNFGSASKSYNGLRADEEMEMNGNNQSNLKQSDNQQPAAKLS